MTFLALIAIIFFGFAVYNLTCAFVDIPTKKTSQMMMLSRKQQGTKNEKLLDVYVTKIAGWIAPYLRLDRLKRNKVQRALDIAGLQLTPEVYTARAWVTAGAVGLCAIPMAFLIPLLVPILIGLAVALWFSTYYAAFDFVKKRRKLIEGEIPRFALTVGQSLENDRDVLKILTSYRRVAGKDFGAELDQTIADMKTGNYENALIRFETRIGSPMLSDVIRGLIGVLRGDDQRMYFKMITFDMRQIEQNNLKKEAAKRPKKIQRYSMMMLIHDINTSPFFCLTFAFVLHHLGLIYENRNQRNQGKHTKNYRAIYNRKYCKHEQYQQPRITQISVIVFLVLIRSMKFKRLTVIIFFYDQQFPIKGGGICCYASAFFSPWP